MFGGGVGKGGPSVIAGEVGNWCSYCEITVENSLTQN